MKRCGVVAVLLCVLYITAMLPAQATHLLTISNLERLSNDGSGVWYSQEFEPGDQIDGCYFPPGSTSFYYDEAYVDGWGFGSTTGRLASIYPRFPLTPGGWNEPNEMPIRFNWEINSGFTPVYLVVYAGGHYIDPMTGEFSREEWAVWNSGPICSYTPVSGTFQAPSYSGGIFRIELTTTPVPEPTGILVIMGGLGALKLRRRK